MKITLLQIDLVMGSRILLNVLREKGHQADCLQINMRYIDTLSLDDMRIIYDHLEGSAVVGISFNTFYAPIAESLSRYLKSKGIKYIIAGGNHATALPDEVIAFTDIVVKYEAEITLLRILEALEAKQIDLSKIGGIVYKKDGVVFYNNEPPEIVWDLDKIPFQSVDVDLIKYFSLDKKIYTPSIEELFPHKDKCFFLLASRGCPFGCTYCSNSLYRKIDKRVGRVRRRSVDNILAEMAYAVSYGFKSFYITDDNFFSFTLEEIELFSHRYKEEIGKPFSVAGINPNNFRAASAEKKLKLLLSCGLTDIRVGVQSGSNKTLAMFNRGYKAEDVPKLLAPLENNRDTIWEYPYNKLHVNLDFICDSIWEEEEDKVATIKLAMKVLSQYSIFFYTLVYLPGTKVYDDAVKNGWFKDKTKDIYLRGIAGVDDTIYNRLLFLVAVMKERAMNVPEQIVDHILEVHRVDPGMAAALARSMIECINGVERYHKVNLQHASMHPYLSGFNEWEKTTGDVGRKVLFRSYHQPYG